MTSTAATLRTLHRIHTQLSDVRERAARGPKQVAARQGNLTRLEAELAKAKNDVKTAKMQSDQKQLLLKTSETKILDLRKKLNACSSNREYQALLEQIAADEMAGSVLSDEILETMDKIDELQKAVGEAQQNLERGKEDFTKLQQTVEAQHNQLESEIVRLEKDLKEAELGLPDDLRDAYDRVVKSRGSDALAEVEGESCGGCYQQITPNNYNALAMNRSVFCQSCGRLLYLPEDRSLRSK